MLSAALTLRSCPAECAACACIAKLSALLKGAPAAPKENARPAGGPECPPDIGARVAGLIEATRAADAEQPLP